IWTVTDASGNTATCAQNVTVQDHELPTISCPAALTDVPTDAGQCFATGVALGTPTVGDNCPTTTVSSNAPTQFPKGLTVVIWRVTDRWEERRVGEESGTGQDQELPKNSCLEALTDVQTDAGQGCGT